MGLDVSYKGEQIARLSATGTATLKLAGKTCEGDIQLSYSADAGGISGGGISGGISGGGSGGAAGSDVVFYDSYDSSVVASYSAAEFARLSELPANPEHAGLIAQGWNWTLENAKAYVAKYGRLIIGQMFITDDGKTRIHIHLEEHRTTPLLGVGVFGSVSIDWGDGSEPDTLTGTGVNTAQYTNRHSYPGGGDYVITLTVEGSIAFAGITARGSSLLRYSTDNTNPLNKVYTNNIKAIEIGNGVSKIGNYAFQFCSSLSHVTIPNGVDGVGDHSFDECCSLQGITIPSGATNIGSYAFNKCMILSYISLPMGTTGIGASAFTYCGYLKTITPPEGVTGFSQNTCQNCFHLANVVIPDTVTRLGTRAFNNAYSLRKIVIPDSVTTIESYALADNPGLTEVTIPGRIKSIGQYALSHCWRLISVEIMDGVTSIGSNAFINCYTLETVTVPASVTVISNNAFANCQGLMEFKIFARTPPNIDTYLFTDVPNDFMIYVPKGTLEAYQTATNWSKFAEQMREMEE